jgi:hypothetical protein
MPLDERMPLPGVNPAAWSTTPQYDSVSVDVLLVNDYAMGPNGPLTLYADPQGPLDAVTLEYLQSLMGNYAQLTYGINPPASPIPGQLWWSETDAQLYIWYQDPNSSQWVIANNTGIQEAPIGTTMYGPITYGRQNRTWVPVLALAGGIMTGPLVLASDPSAVLEAATKGYVDGVLGNAMLGYLPLSGGTMTGPLILSGPPTGTNGAATMGWVESIINVIPVSATPPANPVNGALWFDAISAQLFLYYEDATSSQWVQANVASGGGTNGGGGGTPPGVYLPLTGGTMTGNLILNGPPTATSLPNQAATVGYVQSLITGQLSFLGTVNASTGIPSYTQASGLQGQQTIVPAISVPDTYLICTVAGVFPSGPVQAQEMNIGDWLISDGSQYYIINVEGEEAYAADVIVAPPVQNLGNVQAVLEVLAPTNNPSLTGTPTTVTPPAADNSQMIANTAWVNSQGFITGVILMGDVESVPSEDIDSIVMVGDMTGAVSVATGQPGVFIDDLTLGGDSSGSDSTSPDAMTSIQLEGDADSTTPTRV